jgi:hypothetical protein
MTRMLGIDGSMGEGAGGPSTLRLDGSTHNPMAPRVDVRPPRHA